MTTENELTSPAELAARPEQRTDAACPQGETIACTFKHTKTGGVYELVGDARLQTSTDLSDMAYLVVYRGRDGALWVRPREEFAQRFAPIDAGAAAPSSAPSASPSAWAVPKGFKIVPIESTQEVPRTPAAAWRVTGESDPHAGHYDGERAALCMGHLTDDDLANGAFMNYDQPLNVAGILAGTHSSPIAWMTAVKDRIRWLSRALAAATAAPSLLNLRHGVGDWCAPGPAATQERKFILRFEDADRGEAHYTDALEALRAFDRAEGNGWNCHLFAHVPRRMSPADQTAQVGQADQIRA